ncbi:MAG: arginase family protein [archaeon]
MSKMSAAKFYCVATSTGALGKNKGCGKAPAFLSELFGARASAFRLAGNDLFEQQKLVFRQAKKAFSSSGKKRVVFFGGTHDITCQLFRAFAARHENASLVVLDAHADCDHGILSMPSHEDWLRALIENKIVPAERVMLFGARKIFPSEKKFLENSGICRANSISALRGFIHKNKNVYFSFDVDVLDPKIMPSTHYLESRGIGLEGAKRIAGMLLSSASVKAVDIVEFNPLKAQKKSSETLLAVFKGLCRNNVARIECDQKQKVGRIPQRD